MPDRVYLDHAATTPMRPAAHAAVLHGLALWANPSSAHAEGRRARAALDEARRAIADAFGWRYDIVFTSGATESAAIALRRPARARPVLVSAVEHSAVLRQRPDAITIAVDGDGRVDPAALDAALGAHPGAIVAVQHVNSETGIVQPIAALADGVSRAGGVLFVDCAQSAGKLALPPADLIAISAHKLGGPPGIGALLVRDPALLAAHAGAQEQGYRGGTENLPAILGFAAAAAATPTTAGTPPWVEAQAGWRVRLDAAIVALGGVVVGGAFDPADARRLATIGAYRLPGISAAAVLMRMDAAGFALSAGSACSSGSVRPSHVLAAMGLDEAAAREVFRVSFGWSTTRAEIDALADALCSIVRERTRAAA